MIDFGDTLASHPGEPVTVEFVGGPRAGQVEMRIDTPSHLQLGDGRYRRSVRCADDGLLRYVWEDDGQHAVDP